jgi:hypothetical protein
MSNAVRRQNAVADNVHKANFFSDGHHRVADPRAWPNRALPMSTSEYARGRELLCVGWLHQTPFLGDQLRRIG